MIISKRAFILLANNFLFMLLAQNSYAQTTIYMTKQGGVFTIPCKVNGLDMSFILDTGASDVSISLTEAMYMLKHGQLAATDVLNKEYFTNANGDISVGTKIILRKIEFSGLLLENVEASVVNSFDAPLLLGQTALIKIGAFQFDPSSGVLIILNGKSNIGSNSQLQQGDMTNPFGKGNGRIKLVISNPLNYHIFIDGKDYGIINEVTITGESGEHIFSAYDPEHSGSSKHFISYFNIAEKQSSTYNIVIK